MATLECPRKGCDFTTEFGEQRLKTHITKMHTRKVLGGSVRRRDNGVEQRYAEAVALFYPDGVPATREDLMFLDEIWERVNA